MLSLCSVSPGSHPRRLLRGSVEQWQLARIITLRQVVRFHPLQPSVIKFLQKIHRASAIADAFVLPIYCEVIL